MFKMTALQTTVTSAGTVASGSGDYASPTEAWLARVWADLVRIERIDRSDNFLALANGDPYDVVRLLSRLRAGGYRVDAATVVATPRLEDLARLLERSQPMPVEVEARAIALPSLAAPVIDEPTLPFRFVPEAAVERVSTPGLRLDPTLVARLWAATSRAAPVDIDTLIHSALALALSRCSGRTAVAFLTDVGGAWFPIQVDLASTTTASLVTTVRDQLERLRRRADAGDPAPADATLAESAALPAIVVGVQIEAAADPVRMPAGRAGRLEGADPLGRSAPPVVVCVSESSDGWWLVARGSATAEPQRLVDYLVSALSRLTDALAAGSPAPALALDVMPEAERVQLAAFSRGPAASYPHGTVLAHWIENQARATPDAVAITFAGTDTTYAELDAAANRLARWLGRRGAARGSKVGLCIARGVDMVTAQLAILKLGAAYVPLDPAFPSDRLEFMAADSALSLLVTDSASSTALTWPAERSVFVDRDRASITAEASDGFDAGVAGDDPAYLIYTSGSTGKPKGVVVTNRNAVNFIDAMHREPGIDASTRILAVTTLSFDIHVLELLAPLCIGARIVLADAHQATSGHALQTLIAQHGVTLLQATPSTWNLMIDADWPGSPGLTALIGGEALLPELASQLLQRTAALWNMYGPTETTVWSHCWRVPAPTAEIAVGAPIQNLTCVVLDPAGRRCPVGVPGELWIGGDGVTLGYWDRPELNRERFLIDPDAETPGARRYRTGDLAVWLAAGVVRVLGRLDQQVKIRGHRIELGEIETTIESHPAVAQSVCLVRTDPGGEPRIVAYTRARAAVDPQELLGLARRTLPDYMVPQHLMLLDQYPLLPNGKVNRRALPDPAWTVRAEREVGTAEPVGPIEEALARIWAEVLKVERIGRRDDFFDLGGHSLAAMRVLSRIEKMFDRRLRVASLFEASTLEAQARLIGTTESAESRATSAVVPIHAAGTRPPIFFVSGYGGPILLLQNLARELGPDQPLFLLDFAALTGDGESDTIEAAARALISHMRARQPVGPYHLAGYSLGGPIVYEMAQQLAADGQAVPMLAMLDRFAPGHPRPPSFARRLGLHLREAARRGPRASIAYLGYFTTRLLKRNAHRLGLPVSTRMAGESSEVMTLNLDAASTRLSKASDHYEFRPYAGPLMFIRVEDLSDRGIGTVEPDPVGGWGKLAPEARPIGLVAGTHTTLLFPEHAHRVAELLTRCLDLACGKPDGLAPVPASLPAVDAGKPVGAPITVTPVRPDAPAASGRDGIDGERPGRVPAAESLADRPMPGAGHSGSRPRGSDSRVDDHVA